jgi:hypothetical protein
MKHSTGNVVINPLIHHPSFYGRHSTIEHSTIQRTYSANVEHHLSLPIVKTLVFGEHVFNGLARSPDIPIGQWKISLKEILHRCSI